jgi:hypothetical protein
MEMLLRHVTMRDLAGMYARHKDSSPAPYLKDPKVIRRARRLAKKNGLWDELDRLDPEADIPAFKNSWFRRLRETKDRRLADYYGRRTGPLGRAALAVWLGHPLGDIDYLQDLAWAYCEDSTWVHGVHDANDIDLSASAMGASLAEIVHFLDDRLDIAVRDRIFAEVEKRIFQQFWNYRKPEWWKTVENNWNHVCNGSVIRAALYLIDDPDVLAHMTHAAIQNLTYALDGFADDGGCGEGPAYWNYGFGHYLKVAEALRQRTGGELDIMAGDKIERICRYPLAAHIDGPFYSSFADSGHGEIPAWTALLINSSYAIPELYELCLLNQDRTLHLSNMFDLALYGGEKGTGKPDPSDYELPDLGQAKLIGAPGARQMTIMALAGDNGVSHNHNDIGSFIVYRAGKLLLVDPGAPMYTKQTFSPRRYEIIYCRSKGHSVPVIDGREQRNGSRYRGTLRTENLNGEGPKRAIIDMTQAYPRGTVGSLVRTLELDPKTNLLELCDKYAFKQKPKSIEEVFITFEKATVSRDRKSVRIGTKTSGLEIRTIDAPGKFAIAVLEKESKEHQRTDDIITRITFTPSNLAREICLCFSIG